MARFDWIYEKTGVLRNWDVDLTPECEFATVPTLGAILPNWLLFMPRQHHLSIAQMNPDARIRLFKHARLTMEGLSGREQGDDVAFFEHGAGNVGSLVGCGVDHAHLHAVPLPFSLSDKLLREQDVVAVADSADPWSCVRTPEYLLCVDGAGAYVAPANESISQFFRRTIASEIGQQDRWNYREFPFAENIAETVRNFHVR